VRAKRVRVLLLARHAERGGEAIGALPHRLAGAELGDRRRLRQELSWRETAEELQPLPGGAVPPGVEQAPPDLPREPHRNVPEHLDATGERCAGVTRLDGQHRVGDGTVRRDARHRDRVGGRAVRHAGGERGVPRDVAGGDVLHHRAHHDHVEFGRVEPGTPQQAADDHAGEVVRDEVSVLGARTRERQAGGVDQRDGRATGASARGRPALRALR